MDTWERLTMMAIRPENWATSYESFVTQVTMEMVREGLPHDEARIFIATHLGCIPTCGAGRTTAITPEMGQTIVVAAEDLLKKHGITPGARVGTVDFRQDVQTLFQQLWTKAMNVEGYNKVEWTRMNGYLNELLRKVYPDSDED